MRNDVKRLNQFSLQSICKVSFYIDYGRVKSMFLIRFNYIFFLLKFHIIVNFVSQIFLINCVPICRKNVMINEKISHKIGSLKKMAENALNVAISKKFVITYLN